eukprot:gene600-329_t
MGGFGKGGSWSRHSRLPPSLCMLPRCARYLCVSVFSFTNSFARSLALSLLQLKSVLFPQGITTATQDAPESGGHIYTIPFTLLVVHLALSKKVNSSDAILSRIHLETRTTIEEMLPQAYQQISPTGSAKLPVLGSRALYQQGDKTPSLVSGVVPIPPPARPDAVSAADLSFPCQTSTIGVPVSRHKAKLEECARLHAELEKTKEELQIAKQRIEGTQRDCGDVLTEASRLHDVVKVLTGELHTKQRRVHDLELENKQLRQELSQARTDMELLTASRAVLEKKKRELAAVGGGGGATGTAADAREDEFRRLFPKNKDCGVPTSFTLTSTGTPGGLSAVSAGTSADALAPGALEPISFLESIYTPDEEEMEEEMEEVEEEVEVEVEEEVEVQPEMAATEVQQPIPAAEDALPIVAVETEAPLEAVENSISPGDRPDTAPAAAEERTTEQEILDEAAKKGDAVQQFPEVAIGALEAEERQAAAANQGEDDKQQQQQPAPITMTVKKKMLVIKTTLKPVKKKRLPRTHRPRDVNNPVLMEYLSHCFHHGCAPHVEALRSMYRGDGSLLMVKPPVAFDQLEVYEKLLFTPQPSLLGLWSASHLHSVSMRFEDPCAGVSILARMIPRLPLLQELEVFGVHTTASMHRLTEALAVAANVEVLSLPQLAVNDEGLVLLWNLLRQREQVSNKPQDEEHVKAADAMASLRREKKHGAPSAASTPSNAGSRRHASVVSSHRGKAITAKELTTGASKPHDTPRSADGGAVAAAAPQRGCTDEFQKDEAKMLEPTAAHKELQIRTLDLSHCHVVDSMTIKSICCPGVEVLFLAGLAAAVTDTALHCVLKKCCPSLHTLDISGCTRVTTDAMKYFNRHEHLVVLRAENCPLIKKLELDYVEVLYSPLNYVNELNMPALRRLPVPLENGSLLRCFVAPQLEELSVHAIHIDRNTLQPCLLYTEKERRAFQEDMEERRLHEEVRHDIRRNHRRFEAEEKQRKEEQEAAEAEAAAAALQPKSQASTIMSPSQAGAPSSVLGPDEGGSAAGGSAATGGSRGAEIDEEEEELYEESAAPSSSLPPEDEEGGKQKHWLPNADRTTRATILSRPAPPKLRMVTFHSCHFTDAEELLEFLRQQDQLEKLVLHHCSGVRDEHLKVLPKSLRDLDLALTGSLTDDALRFIVTRAPELLRLNLKGAGIAITNNGIHSLFGLSHVQQLNLLQLQPDAVTGSCVSALASSLPKLMELYHETAVVAGGGASAPGRRSHGGTSSFLHVYRTDTENSWLGQVKSAPLQLLRLRNSAALKLWMETTLPKPSSLWPVAKAHTMDVAADRAKPALLYTPTPPHAWMAQHPLRPGYTALLINANGVAALRPPPGAAQDQLEGEAKTPSAGSVHGEGGRPAANDEKGAAAGGGDGAAGGLAAGAGGGTTNPDGSPMTPEQLAAARKRAAMEASFSSTSTEENEEEDVHRVGALRSTNSANPPLVNPNEVAPGSGGAPSHNNLSAHGGPHSHRSREDSAGGERSSSNVQGMTMVDQKAVEDAEMGPWGEEDAMAEHQELVRNIQQQDPAAEQ